LLQDELKILSHLSLAAAHPIHRSWYDWEGQEGRDGEKVWYQLGSLTYSISAENPYASVAGERHDAVQKL